MTEPEVLQLSSAQQHSALGHPLRLRLLFTLGEGEATISQLAVRLETRKGNIAHHLKVLLGAGLVLATHSRQVRGGTEQYYARAARRFELVGEDTRSQTSIAVRVVADEIAAAPADPFLLLRHLRLTGEQVTALIETLTEVAHGLAEAPADQPRHTLLLGVYQRDE